MSQRLKILFLPRWYPSKIDPMPGLFIERHAALAARFADVAVLGVIPSDDRIETETEKQEHLCTLRCYFKQGQTGSKFFNALINQYRWLTVLFKGYLKLRKEKKGFDLLHVNVLTRLGLFALLIKTFENIPYVITEHWTRYHNGGFTGKFRIALTRLVVRKAAKVSTVTAHLWQSMQSFGIRNPNHMVLQNVADELFFKSFKITTTVEVNTPSRFIHLSCFTDRAKNISGLLNVLAGMNHSGIEFECLLVGEGEDLEMLKGYAAQLGLKKPKVQFTGLLTGERLAEAMHSASFLVLFSNYENMPVVINEAFAMGLPVIATDTGGISEQVKDWNGRLVKPGDEEALFGTIRYFLKHADRFDREAIRYYAELWFSGRAVEMQLKQLYDIAE